MGTHERLVEGPLLVIASLLLSAGCGAHYWQRSGADVPDFQRDSQGCIADATVARAGIEPEQVYRACMRGRGWQRVKAGVPESNQFRGPEDVEDFAKPPSPTTGQGTVHNEATTDVACRQPTASRPPGVVCRTR